MWISLNSRLIHFFHIDVFISTFKIVTFFDYAWKLLPKTHVSLRKCCPPSIGLSVTSFTDKTYHKLKDKPFNVNREWQSCEGFNEKLPSNLSFCQLANLVKSLSQCADLTPTILWQSLLLSLTWLQKCWQKLKILIGLFGFIL